MFNLLRDLLFDYTLRNIAFGSAILGVVGGVLGSFALLRQQGLLGDALAHAALPGICIAFMLTGSRASLVLLLGAGIGVSGFATNQSTIILANVPEDVRGRAMGVLTAAIGTMPFGALLIGALASATSAPLAIIIMAGLCTTLVALITLLSPRLRAH